MKKLTILLLLILPYCAFADYNRTELVENDYNLHLNLTIGSETNSILYLAGAGYKWNNNMIALHGGSDYFSSVNFDEIIKTNSAVMLEYARYPQWISSANIDFRISGQVVFSRVEIGLGNKYGILHGSVVPGLDLKVSESLNVCLSLPIGIGYSTGISGEIIEISGNSYPRFNVIAKFGLRINL